MAYTDYTLAEIKVLILAQANNIVGLKSAFSSTDATNAYDEACRECGFELPEADDTDKRFKYQWIMNRMRRWFLFQLWQNNIQIIDSGDLKAAQIVRSCERIVEKMDSDFLIAKVAADTAHLFVSADIIFGSPLVVGSGFIEDRIGETTQYEIDDRKTS